MLRHSRTVAMVLLLVVTACAPSSQPTNTSGGAQSNDQGTPKKGGALRLGIENFDPNLDPTQMGTQYTRHISNNIFNHLLDVDVNAKPVPELATSWEFTNDTTLVLKLAPNVKFHDGTPFNAEAAKWNIELTLDPATNARKRSQFEDISSVEAVDPTTLRINLKRPSAPFLTNLADTTGFMMSPTAYKTMGAEAYGQKPVGTGPFKFVSMTPNERVELVRNDEYWESGKPYLDKLTVIKIPNQSVRLAALRSGDVDMIDFIPPQEAASLKADPNFIYSELPGTIYDGSQFNTSKAPFNNLNLRRAVAYAIDPTPMRKVVFFDTGVGDRGYQYPSLWSYNKDFKGLPYDQAKAKEALAAGGYPNGGFKFTLKTSNREIEMAIAEILKNQLKAVGIEMDINAADSVKYIADTTAGDFEMGLGPVSMRTDPDTGIFERFHSTGTANVRAIKYNNPKVDDLLAQGRSTYDQAKRTQIYQEIERITTIDDVMGVYYGHRAEQKVYPKKVKGFVHNPDYVIRAKTIWLE